MPEINQVGDPIEELYKYYNSKLNFGKYNEFKSLMQDQDIRKNFFTEYNDIVFKQYGHKLADNFDEFEDVLGFKKKANTNSLSGHPTNAQQGSSQRSSVTPSMAGGTNLQGNSSQSPSNSNLRVDGNLKQLSDWESDYTTSSKSILAKGKSGKIYIKNYGGWRPLHSTSTPDDEYDINEGLKSGKTYEGPELMSMEFENSDVFKKLAASSDAEKNKFIRKFNNVDDVDQTQLREWTKNYLQANKININQNGDFANLIQQKLKEYHVNKINQTEIGSIAKSLYKKKYGIDIEQDVQQAANNSITLIGGKDIESSESKGIILKNRYEGQIKSADSEYKSKIEELNNNFQNPEWIRVNFEGKIPQGQSSSQAIKDAYKKSMTELYNAYYQKHSSINKKFRSEFNSIRSSLEGKLKQISTSFQNNPAATFEINKRIQDIYFEASQQYQSKLDASRKTELESTLTRFPVLRQAQLFGKSLWSGTTVVASNLANYLDNAVGANWTQWMSDALGDYSKGMALPSNPIKNFTDLTDIDKVLQNLGEMLPPMAPSVAVGLITRNIAAGQGTFAALAAGGLGGTIADNIQRQGDLYQSAIENGFDPITAKERSKKVWQDTPVSILTNSIQLQSMLGKIGGGNFLKRWGTNAAAETATEFVEERKQTNTEQRALGVPEGLLTSNKELLLTLLPTTLLLPGISSAAQSVKAGDSFAPKWITNIASYPVNKITEMIVNTSKNAVKTAVDLQRFNGLINDKTAEQFNQSINKINEQVQIAKSNGLNKKNQALYVTMLGNAEAVEQKIAEARKMGVSEEQIKILEEKRKEITETANNLLVNKSGNFATIKKADGDVIYVTHDQLQGLLQDDSFSNEVKAGQTSVSVMFNKKGAKTANQLIGALSSLNPRHDFSLAEYPEQDAHITALKSSLGLDQTVSPSQTNTIQGLIGKQVTLDRKGVPVTGELKYEGQTLVLENDDVIIELGNKNEFNQMTPSDIGITYNGIQESSPIQTKSESEVNVNSLISLYAGKISPETLINTIHSVVPTIDKNILASKVMAYDSAYRKNNSKTKIADESGEKKIDAPTLSVGNQYSGSSVADSIIEIGDNGNTALSDKVDKVLGRDFIGMEIDLDELYAKDKEFAKRVDQEKESNKPNVEASKKKYNNPEDAPAVIIDGKIVDGKGRLAQLYNNGQRKAKAFVSSAKAKSSNTNVNPNNKESQNKTTEAKPVNDVQSVVDKVFEEVFGNQNPNAISETELSNQIEKARRILKAILPEAEIYLHNSPQAYEASVVPLGGNPNSAGNAAFRTVNGKTQVYRIDINASKANTRTVSHELAHAVLLNGFGANEDLFNKFRDTVISVLRDSDVQSLNDFASQYSNANAEEFLAELSGALRSGEISPTILSRIAQLINDIVSAITGGKFTPFEDIQNANDIIEMLSTLEPFDATVGEELDGSRPQSVSLSKGTETLKKYGIKPGDPTRTRLVGEALEKRQRAKYGVIDSKDYSDDAKRKISAWMVSEVKYFIEIMGENSGKGWYGEKYQKALDAMSKIFPEMATDQNARDLFTMLVAITSDGQKVLTNFKYASIAYDYYKKNNVLPETLPGQREASFEGNLARINNLLKEYNGDIAKLKNDLLKISSISEINSERKKEGLEALDTSWPVEFKAPFAASVFGPKLGMFYANLSGQENYPTLDRWWSRTFNRYRGTLIPTIKQGYNTKGKAIGITNLKNLLGDSNISDEQALIEAKRLRDSYAKKGYKNGTDLEKAGNTIYKNAYENLNDQPFGKKDRQFMYDSVMSAVKKLNSQGFDLSVADVQAILWYYEKNLYKKLGVRANIAGISYEEAANITFDKWNNAGREFKYKIKKSDDFATVEQADEEIEEEIEGSRSQVIPAQMISPNELEGTGLDESIPKMRGIAPFLNSMSGFDKYFGVESSVSSALGVWQDGGEESSVTRFKGDIDFNTMRLIGAIKGMFANQKAVLSFKAKPIENKNTPIEEGHGFMFEFSMPGSVKSVTKTLTDGGIQYQTISPVGENGTKVYLYADNESDVTKYISYLDSNKINYDYDYGQGEFTGTWGSREEAYPVYNSVIQEAINRGDYPNEQIREFLKRDDESISAYRDRISKIISERTGQSVDYYNQGSRSQLTTPNQQFITQLKSKGLTDDQIKYALISKLNLSDQKAQLEIDLNNKNISLPTGFKQVESSLSKKAKAKFNKYFNRNKGNPGFVLPLTDKAKGERNLFITKAHRLVKRVQDLAKSINFTDWELFDNTIRNLKKDDNGEYIDSSYLDQLPEDMAFYAVAMRDMIDGLGSELIAGGYVTPEQALTIESNMGEYLTRSYKIYNQKNFAKSIPQKIKDEAYQLLFSQNYTDLFNEDPNRADIFEAAASMAANDLQEILDGVSDRYTPDSVRTMKGRDVGILKKRQDIPKQIRELMGEVHDPGMNFMLTISRIAALKTQSSLFSQMRNIGMGSVFFEKDDPRRPQTHSVQIFSEGNSAYKPLDGLYTTPEISESLLSQTDTGVNWYIKAVGAIRWGKTVGSIVTQFKNLESNVLIALMNGDFLPTKRGEAFKYYINELFLNKEIESELIDKAISYNLLDQSIGVKELNEMLKNDDVQKIMLSVGNLKKDAKSNTIELIKKPFNYLNKVYSASDNLWKLHGFVSQQNIISESKFKTDYKNLSDSQKKIVDDEAAERVKNTYPTYDRVWEGAKYISKRAPVLGNFLSFQAESIRILLNNFEYAIKDMNNPEMRQAGARRMAGIIAYLSGRSSIIYYLAQLSGIGMSGIMSAMNGALGDDDEKDKQLKSLNRYVPSFMVKGEKYLKRHEDNKITVYDFASIDPYNLWFRVFNAFTNGDGKNAEPGITSAAIELLSPFLGTEMTFQTLIEINQNADGYGRKISANYKEDGSKKMLGDHLIDYVAYAGKKLKPSTIDYIFRLRDKDNKANEAAALWGMKGYDIDLVKAFSIKLSNAEQDIKDANYQFRSVKFDKNATDQEKKSAKLALENIYSSISKNLHEDINAAIRLGANPVDIKRVLKEKNAVRATGFDKEFKRSVFQGKPFKLKQKD